MRFSRMRSQIGSQINKDCTHKIINEQKSFALLRLECFILCFITCNMLCLFFFGLISFNYFIVKKEKKRKATLVKYRIVNRAHMLGRKIFIFQSTKVIVIFSSLHQIFVVHPPERKEKKKKSLQQIFDIECLYNCLV